MFCLPKTAWPPTSTVELPKYIKALQDAGLDKVKAELEKQYADWKAKKGK